MLRSVSFPTTWKGALNSALKDLCNDLKEARGRIQEDSAPRTAPAFPALCAAHRPLEREVGQRAGCGPRMPKGCRGLQSRDPTQQILQDPGWLHVSEMEVSQDRSPEQEHGPQTLCILVSQILVTAHKMGFRVSDEMGVRALDDTGITLHLLPMLDAPHTQGTGALFQIILPTELLHQDAPLRFQTPTHSPLLRPSIISSPPRDPTIMLTPPETSHHPLSPLSPSITPSEIPLTPSPPLSPLAPGLVLMEISLSFPS